NISATEQGIDKHMQKNKTDSAKESVSIWFTQHLLIAPRNLLIVSSQLRLDILLFVRKSFQCYPRSITRQR
ncbi:MAG: hypothetical protein J6J05_10700, partial [Peptococcaceae bacterium]|nr:hypothetical protein [Peptococcaceae bacterium]